MNNRLLIVDDDEIIRMRLASIFKNEGYDVDTADNPHAGLALLKNNFFPVIISDQRMPRMTGIEFLTEVSRDYPNTVRIIFSSFEDFSEISNAFNQGIIYKYLSKKSSDVEIIKNATAAFYHYEQVYKNQTIAHGVESALEGVIITDKTGVVQKINATSEKLLGVSCDDLRGKNIDIFKCSNSELEDIERSISEHGCWQGKIQVKPYKGDSFPALLSINSVKNNIDAIENFIYCFIDTSDNERIKQELSYEIHHDKQTGLCNRRSFTKKIADQIARQSEHGNIVLITLDIERFRNVNTAFGESYGDEALKTLANNIQHAMESRRCFISRVGDDQFSVAVFNPVGKVNVDDVVNDLLNLFNHPLEIKGRKIYLSAHFGSSTYPDDEKDPTILLKKSIDALNHAKQLISKPHVEYKNTIHVIKNEKIIISDVLSGMKNDEFIFYYQPKVDRNNNRIVSAEALLRWQHPKHGLLVPSEFLPICEDTHLIVDIERKMLVKALRFLKTVNDQANYDFYLSINISPYEFESSNIKSLLEDIFKTTGVDPKFIELEITESNLLNNLEEIRRAIKELRNMGIKIALDDFGKGYSSLRYLTEIEIDTVKIDRSFIKNLFSEPKNKIILQTILDLCEKMQLKTVVEGIETQEQHDFLSTLKCDELQGYLFSHPLSEQEMRTLLKVRNDSN